MAVVEKYVEGAMSQSYGRFEAGVAGIDALQQGLQVAELSAKAYPKSPEQERWRTVLAARRPGPRLQSGARRVDYAQRQETTDFRRAQGRIPPLRRRRRQDRRSDGRNGAKLQGHRAGGNDRSAESQARGR